MRQRGKKTPELSERLLILAPVARDSELMAELAKRHGFQPVPLRDFDSFLEEFPCGIGAAVLTEEALHMGRVRELADLVQSQPEWSDVPFIVIASRADAEERALRTVNLSKPLRNVTIIERPVRPSTLIAAFEAAMRDRRRQYDLRDVLRRYQMLSAELEDRVKIRTEELIRANGEMEGFTYSVSHDLRAPLRAIGATSMILKQDFGHLLPPAAIEQLDRQVAASRKLGNLIDDLLRLSRLSRQELTRKPVDLTALARDVADEVLSRTPTCVEIKIDEDLKIEADPTLMRLAMLNLIENAVKFSPKGGEVRIGAEGSNGKRTFYVKDHGIGIDGRYKHKVFLPFERLVTEAEFPGTGIGLANVQRIIQKHGGEVWVESDPGEGSTFMFTL